MKSTRTTTMCVAFGLLSLLSLSARAEIFTDTLGEINSGIANAGGTLDFVRMEVTDNASDVVLTLTVNGNTTTTDWGNFMIGIATTKSTGTTSGNGWGRPISLNVVTNGVTNGMTHWIGSWVSGAGGSQFWTYDTSWTNRGSLPGFAVTAGIQSTISYTVSKTSLGVTTGDTIYFDAYSSGGGGGDSAIDALANPVTSVNNWSQNYISSNTNNTVKSYTLTFNVSDSDGDGLPDAWETEKFSGLSQDGAGDPDSDSLTNAQEYAAGTNPSAADSDTDGLNDGAEITTHTTNPLVADTDGDGVSDGAEITAGTNPKKFNYAQITVAGSFQGWSPAPAVDSSNVMTKVVGEEFGWQLNFRMAGVGSYVGKFTAGGWSVNWGTTATPGLLQQGGFGNDIPFNVTASGVWRFYINTDTLAYSFTRASAPATYGDWAAQYGLLAGSGAEDPDTDTLTNDQEFAANTDPNNADTDGDGISDSDETSGAYANLKIGSPVLTSPLNGDTDADGLPDKWELDYYLDPNDDGTAVSYTNYIPTAFGLTVTGNPNGAGSNPDGDPLTNLQEFSGGKNPIVAEGDIASTYAKLVVAGSFVQTKPDGNWDEVGNSLNTMQLVSNFTWKLIAYVPAPLPTFAQFKFTTGSWSTNFGDNIPVGGAADGVGDLNGSNIDALPVFTVAGYYMITFNDFTKAYTLAPLGSSDADTDGLPDEWEAFYGGYLNPKLTNLDPATAYVVGSSTTAAQAYAAGSNPVLDSIAPTVALAAGIESLTWLALNSNSGQYVGTSADVAASDNLGTPAVAVLHRLISGSNPGVFDAVDTTTAGLWQLEYTATDGYGNSATFIRVVMVGDQPATYYGLNYPASATISTLQSQNVYAQIYLANATPGGGQAPNIQCWIGVNSANTDPATWAESVWTLATNNPGQTGSNDEYSASLSGATLGAGTYYYAARWQIGSGAFFYGGINTGGNGNAWNAATHPSGVLTVTPVADPLADYMTGFGLSGANAAGTADPDGDGMDNNAEFAFGTSPVSGASRAATLSTGTGTIKLSYLQRDSGVAYTVKSLPDLVTAFDSGTTVTPSVSADQSNKPAGYTRYEAELNTGLTRGFLRVKAVAP